MKFSRMFFMVCGFAGITGCAYIIPPEQNVPRNNIVIGDPHRPALNNRTTGPRTELAPRPGSAMPQPPVIAQNDMPPPPAAALPPVDEATRTQADAIIAREAANAEPSAGTPQPVASTHSDRHVPVENAAFQVAARSDYPNLNAVPPRPALSGPDSAKERLGAVQNTLEQDRTAATAAKETLARDAAAEPSMLSELPKADAVPAVTPAPAVNVLPAPTPMVTVPVRESIRTITPAPAAKPVSALVPVGEPAQAQISVKPTPVATGAIMPTQLDPIPPGETFTIAKPRTVVPAANPVAPVGNPVVPATYIAKAPLAPTVPNTPDFAPPAPRNEASTPAPRVVAAAPEPVAITPVKTTTVVATAPAPIVLSRPVESVPVIAAQDLPAPAAPANFAAAEARPNTAATSMPTVKRGDFDPLASADNAPIAASAASTTTTYSAPATYASSRYLSSSRYADRRY